MMASQLHEAVQLAQTGRKEDARRMLRQVVQNEPNNEMAWLWLASVAADQVEYQHALNEVLRVNPANQQARQLMDEFQQQYGAPHVQPQTPPPTAPYTTPPQTPPPYSSGPVSPVQPQQSTPYYGTPAPYQPPDSPRPIEGAKPPKSVVRYEVQTAKSHKKGCLGCGGCGCGCVQTCLALVVIFFVLPIVACGVLSFTSHALGPADFAAVYLPGELGRKEVEFEAEDYEVSLKVPRSWYVALSDNRWWSVWSEMLDDAVTLAEPGTSWVNFETNSDVITKAEGGLNIVETNPATLTTGGAPIIATFQGFKSGDDYGVTNFSCDTLRDNRENLQARFGEDSDVPEILPVHDTDLCSVRVDRIETVPDERIFSNFDPPNEMRVIQFVVPFNATTGQAWTIMLPEEQYGTFKDDIDRMVETAEAATW